VGTVGDVFSLPYGTDAMGIRAVLEERGIRAVVTTRHGLARVDGSPWGLPRLNVGRHEGAAFTLLLAGIV